MPIDGITLGAIAQELNNTLSGGRIDRIQQPERDELVITVRAGGKNHKLYFNAGANHARVHISEGAFKSPDTPPMFCMLMRKHLMGAHFLHIEQHSADRILDFWFEALDELGDLCKRRLVLEVMGRHSNLALVDEKGRITDCIRHVGADISRVREMLPGLPYERPPEQDKLNAFVSSSEDIAKALYPHAGKSLKNALQQALYGLSPQIALEWAFRLSGTENKTLEEADVPGYAEKLCGIYARLAQMGPPSLYMDGDTPLDATPFPYLTRTPDSQREMPSLSAAIDACFRTREQNERVEQRRSALEKTLQAALEKAERKLAVHLEAQQAAQNMEDLRIRGDLLLSSLHMIPRGLEAVTVPDYYSEDLSDITISLDPALSPMENVQRYYKQYNRTKAAAQLAEGQIKQDRADIDVITEQLENLEKCQTLEDLSELRQELVSQGLVRPMAGSSKKQTAAVSRPMHFRSSDNTDIYVGKNNLQNERLTFSAGADETWLHAKDMPGSHVIVRSVHPSRQTLYEAALLAAHFSRGARSANVPVDYALRRHVKKPSGSRPGYVTYSNQTTLFVTPDEANLKPIRRLDAE